jgi:hypothetical protein
MPWDRLDLRLFIDQSLSLADLQAVRRGKVIKLYWTDFVNVDGEQVDGADDIPVYRKDDLPEELIRAFESEEITDVIELPVQDIGFGGVPIETGEMTLILYYKPKESVSEQASEEEKEQ